MINFKTCNLQDNSSGALKISITKSIIYVDSAEDIKKYLQKK